jgi:FlaA1/EpsC-like NDP-sugar epimerase
MFSIFSQQIKERRAVTITDPEMQRYIMSVFEAVLLVLQAVTIADSGEIFTLDIGKPVKIIDFARQMIRFYGYEVDKEIPIVFIGARPGEKMSEEYIKSDEQFLTSRYENILITKTRRKAADSQGLKVVLEELRANCQYQQADKIICFLKRLVPEFKPQRG